MPINPVTDKIYSLGSFKRSYDDNFEIDLAWLGDDVKESPEVKAELAKISTEEQKEAAKKDIDEKKQEAKKDSSKKNDSKLALSLTLIAAIKAKDNKVILDVFKKTFPFSITEQLDQLIENITYGVRDLFNWSRVKTSLTTLSTIGAGVGIGALAGSVLLPGLGTWLGGTAGSAISSVVSTLGGAFGISVLGGVGGSWFGSSIAKRAFKDEYNYQPSVQVTDQLNDKFNIDPSTAWKMNAYLYNRLQLTTNDTAKDIYRTLRKKGIDNGNEEALNKIAHFFCQELKLLQQERQRELDSEERAKLSREFTGVHAILSALKNAKLPEEAKQKITQTLQAVRLEISTKQRSGLEKNNKARLNPSQAKIKLAANPPRKPLVVSAKSHLSAQVQRQMEATFEAQLQKDQIKIVKTIEQRQANEIERTIEFTELPAVSYKEFSDKGHNQAAVALKQDDFLKASEKKQAEIIKVFVAQALAYANTADLKAVRVLACGDVMLAEKIAVALLQGGLTPKFDKKEFPNKQDRLALLASARQKAQPSSQKRVGLVLKPNRLQ